MRAQSAVFFAKRNLNRVPLASVANYAKFCVVKKFFRPNIKRNGRIARGVIGALCLIAGIILQDFGLWQKIVGLVLIAAGIFAIFEAIGGWCLIRACGIKTKI